MKRALHIVAIPVVAGAIYSWMIYHATRDGIRVLARRWWPAPPVDYP